MRGDMFSEARKNCARNNRLPIIIRSHSGMKKSGKGKTHTRSHSTLGHFVSNNQRLKNINQI